eukprot:6200354-Pleurochrysis_carterae.AAC.2
MVMAHQDQGMPGTLASRALQRAKHIHVVQLTNRMRMQPDIREKRTAMFVRSRNVGCRSDAL